MRLPKLWNPLAPAATVGLLILGLLSPVQGRAASTADAAALLDADDFEGAIEQLQQASESDALVQALASQQFQERKTLAPGVELLVFNNTQNTLLIVAATEEAQGAYRLPGGPSIQLRAPDDSPIADLSVLDRPLVWLESELSPDRLRDRVTVSTLEPTLSRATGADIDESAVDVELTVAPDAEP